MTDGPGPGRLRSYFSVPSTRGFSPYRTGVGLHVVFSVVVGAAAFALVTRMLGGPWWSAAIAAQAVVVALWGVGWMLGVTSHYVFMPAPQVALVALALAVALIGRQALAPAGVGFAAHVVAAGVLGLLSPR